MSPSWGWKVTILFLLHKAQSIPFSFGWGGVGREEKKQLIKYHFALAWFSLIKPYNQILSVNDGHEAKVFISPLPFSPPPLLILKQ